MAGLPKLVTVLESARDGKKAYYEDGMVAEYDYTTGIWRPATAHISYEALFCTTTSGSASEPDLTLSPEVAVED
jgi:phage baseplate assembly protein gpV